MSEELTDRPTPPLPAMPAQRLHPLTPLVKGWLGVVALAFFVGRAWVENGGKLELDGLGTWVWIGIAALGLSLVAGLIGWVATRYRLDDDALRLETNFIWNSSSVINYSKIQSIDIVTPFAARLLGVCGLRIDVGSGAPNKLEFLGRAKAEEVRDELARRAALSKRSADEGLVRDNADDADAPALEAGVAPSTVLVRVGPQRLLVAALTSSEFLVAVVLTILGLIPSLVTGRFVFAGFLFPALWSIVALISSRIVKEWDYRLETAGPGTLRVARGLTDTATQTVPIARVQGFELEQPWLWRRFGWWRVKFAVLGYQGEDATQGGSTVLLPVGTWDEMTLALTTIWPDFDWGDFDWQGVPSQARWAHPIDWRQRGWAMSDHVMADRSGRFSTQMSLVRHARAQSWQVAEGPLSRRLGLATIAVHISGSTVSLSLNGTDREQARAWLDGYSDRVRSSVADEGMHPPSVTARQAQTQL